MNERYELNEEYTLNYEECCFLLLKVVEQAIRDYCLLQYSNLPYKDFYWQTARDFLFEDDYFIDWGSLKLCLGNICEILCCSEKSFLNIDWVRRKAQERYKREKARRNK